MKLLSKKTILLLVIPLLLIFFIVLFVPFQTALVFYEENTHHIEAYLPIEEGDHFQMIYTHSIHLTDVEEKYKVLDNQDIEQYETVYEHYGIGMPSNAGEGESFVSENGKYHIKNIGNVFPLIKYRNGKTVSENRLVWGEDAEHLVWFNEYFEPGAWFTITVKDISLWEYVRGVKIHE